MQFDTEAPAVVMADRCLWCGHLEDEHSLIFRECSGSANRTDMDVPAAITCPCKEFAPTRPALSLRRRIAITAAAAGWWLITLLGRHPQPTETIRARIRYLEEHTR